MADKYQVIRPWHGVKIGDVVEFEKLHPSLKSHVIKLSVSSAGYFSPASSDAGTDAKTRKEAIIKRLEELGIEHKGNLGVERLSELLPEGELQKLFPDE